MGEAGVLIAGRYRLRSRVGAGGMGVVWEAWDERLHRAVALKLLHRAPALDEAEAHLASLRAMREARITARLHHRNAVPVFDVVEHDGQACLVMPLLSAMTLAAVLQEGGPLSVAEAVQVGGQIASALAAAHQAGIVHRDVKPGNILITEDGTALISDFGIAHALGEATLTSTGLIHGTPAYLAPELARGGEATYASDVYSFGATLYHALEGAPPFGTDQNSIALLHRIAAGHFEPPTHGGHLTPIVLHALDTDPLARPSMAAVAQALSALARAPAEPIGQQAPASGAAAGTPAHGPMATPPPPAAPPAAVAGAGGEMPIVRTDLSQAQTRPARTVSPPGLPARNRRRRRTAVGLLVGALTLVGGTTVALLLQPYRAHEHVTAGGSSATAVRPTTASTVTQSSTAASPAGPTSPSTSPTRPSVSSPSPSPSSRTPASQPTVRGTPTARELAGAITSYYGLMPDHPDEGWPRMTAPYQTTHAGGRTAYENFWRPVRRVTADHVSGHPPDQAEATITYYYRDGRVVRERTTYRLENSRGALKIADSRVLSSATL